MSGISINEDFENFMASYPPEKMTEAGIREQVDHYATGQVKRILYNPNGMRAVFDSKKFETLWGEIEVSEDERVFYRGKEIFDTPLPVKTNALNCRRLHENVDNPFQTRIDYGRSKGRQVWLSMRMNDVHWATDPDFLMNSDYFHENPQLRRAPYNTNSWHGQALDYGKPEVRRHFLALVEEYLDTFDLDGLELDWMRTLPHFKPGYELHGTPALNDFMREVRSLADKAEKRLGHSIEIGVRLPSRPEDARLNGLDFLTWTKEGLVKLVVPTAYWASTDFDMPLELWRELLPKEVTLAAGLELLVRPNEHVAPFYNTAEIVAGFAASFLYRGADEIYLFNHMDGLVGMKDKAAYKTVLECCGERQTAEKMPRRHVVTYTDKTSRAEGIAINNIIPFDLVSGHYHAVRINIGGGVCGRQASVMIGVQSGKPVREEDLEVRFNTGICSVIKQAPDREMPENDWTLMAFSICAEDLHDGNCMIEFTSKVDAPITVVWCEVILD